MSSKNLRLLIIAYGLLVLGLILLQPFADVMLPPDIRYCLGIEGRSVLDSDEPFFRTDVRGIVFYAQLIAFVAAIIGLACWKSWARTLFLACVAVNIAMLPLEEVQFSESWWTLFNYISILMEGALLALIYLSPFKANYEQSESAAHVS